MPGRRHPAHAPSSVILRDPEGILRILKRPGFCDTRAGLRYAVLAFGTRVLAFATQATRDFGLAPGVCYTDPAATAMRVTPAPALYERQYSTRRYIVCITECVGGSVPCRPEVRSAIIFSASSAAITRLCPSSPECRYGRFGGTGLHIQICACRPCGWSHVPPSASRTMCPRARGSQAHQPCG